jgi:F-type H+-transporting ATPase subunit epsilon
MAEKLKVELMTPYRKVLAEEVDTLTATGTMGEFGLLPGHAPYLTSLKIGELSYTKDGVTYHLALTWGYLEVENDEVIILVETAERADEIDMERAKVALGRAEEALKRLSREDKDFAVHQSAIERALIRMQVAGKGSRK